MKSIFSDDTPKGRSSRLLLQARYNAVGRFHTSYTEVTGVTNNVIVCDLHGLALWLRLTNGVILVDVRYMQGYNGSNKLA